MAASSFFSVSAALWFFFSLVWRSAGGLDYLRVVGFVWCSYALEIKGRSRPIQNKESEPGKQSPDFDFGVCDTPRSPSFDFGVEYTS